MSSSLLQSASIHTISRFINAIIPFLMMPILTRYLSPTDYGFVAIFNVLLGVAAPFVGLSTNGAIGVRYFNKTKSDLSKYIGNCLIVLATSFLVIALMIWLFSEPISVLSAFPRDWLWLIAIVAASQNICNIMMTIWQVDNKAVKYGIFQNLLTLTNISLSIVFVVVLKKNWQGRIEAQVISAVIFSVVAFYLLYRNGWLKFSFDKGDISDALRFGVPIIPHELGAMMIVQTDRMFLANMVGVATAGIFSVGYQFGNIIQLFTSSFNAAYVPWLYGRLKLNDPLVNRNIVYMTYIYFVVIVIIAIVLSLITPWFLKYYVGKDFVSAGKYVFWIALGYAFNGMYYMIANYICFAGKTAVLALVTFVTALLNIGFNYVLIKVNGPVGAAQASALSFFVSFVFTWILSARVYSMPWNILSLMKKN
jgi:O-antigen/teichoic acid export membrane protein